MAASPLTVKIKSEVAVVQREDFFFCNMQLTTLRGKGKKKIQAGKREKKKDLSRYP